MADEASHSRLRGILIAFALTVLAVLAAELLTLPAILADPTLLEAPGEAARASITALMILNFLGFVVVGALYLWLTERGWDYLDLKWPSVTDGIYIVAGTIAGLGAVFAVNLLSYLLDIEPTESQVVQFVEGDPIMVLIMIGIVFLFNAPAEEFLFRNVIQKRLYLVYTRPGAVVVTSVIFALVHLPVFAFDASGDIAAPDSVFAALTVIFFGSVIFGYLYAKTDNLVVPIGAHALFNATQFGLNYVFGFVLEDTSATLTLVGA